MLKANAIVIENEFRLSTIQSCSRQAVYISSLCPSCFTFPDGSGRGGKWWKTTQTGDSKMSTHCGAVGQLSEHDGEIIDIFTPCQPKIICSAPRENPQYTIRQQLGPASVRKVQQDDSRLSPFSLTPSELKPNLYSDWDFATILCPGHSHLLVQI